MIAISPVLEYHSIEEKEYEKKKDMRRLMDELEQGKRSGEEEGYVSSEKVRAYFHGEKS